MFPYCNFNASISDEIWSLKVPVDRLTISRTQKPHLSVCLKTMHQKCIIHDHFKRPRMAFIHPAFCCASITPPLYVLICEELFSFLHINNYRSLQLRHHSSSARGWETKHPFCLFCKLSSKVPLRSFRSLLPCRGPFKWLCLNCAIHLMAACESSSTSSLI